MKRFAQCSLIALARPRERERRYFDLKRVAFIGIAAALLAGCQDQPLPTSPDAPRSLAVTADAADGGTWTLTGSMSVPRRDHTATLLNDGTVLVVGGSGGGGPLLYNPATQAFSSAGTTVFGHGSLPSATKLLDGTVLIVGGESALTSAEIYDPATLTFSATTGGTHANRRGHSATLLNDGRVLLAGGQDQLPKGVVTHALAELYDPSTGTFSLTASLNDHRSVHSATLLPSGNVLIVGGIQTTSPGIGFSLASAEIYSVGGASFSFTGSLTTGRGDLWIWSGSSLLGNGKVLVVGGTTAAAELFDPATGTFSATGSMATRHHVGTATLLSDGRVLVAGGNIGPFPVVITGRAELYNPATAVFTLAATMNVRRQQHSATLLLDGQVLVVGGFGGVSGANLSSAELYIPLQRFIQVDIDIKPGSDPNSINCYNDKEVITVAILTTEDFDATTVDHTTVTFEGASETHVNKKTGVARRHEEDVDGDGDTDLVFHFRFGDTGFSCADIADGDKSANLTGTLTGETEDGTPIEGEDNLRLVRG